MLLPTVELSGKEYPLSFGYNALSMYENLTGKSFMQMGQNLNIEELLAVCYVGLKDGARKSKSEFDLTIQDVGDLLDENESAFEDIMSAFKSQQTKEDTTEKKTKAKANKSVTKPKRKKRSQ